MQHATSIQAGSRTPLNTDFGHQPVGQLGDRSVQQGQAGKSRSLKRWVMDGFKSISSRIAASRQPGPVRAEAEYRRNLNKFSLNMGSFLGAISSGNEASIIKAFGKLNEKAAPLLKKGVVFEELVHARLDVNLERMTPAQLVKLRQGLEKAINSPVMADDGMAATLTAAHKRVNLQIESRLSREMLPKMDHVLETAVKELDRAAQKPGAIVYQHTNLVSCATRMIDTYGLTEVHHQPRKVLENAMTKQFLEEAAMRNPQSEREVRSIIGYLSSSQLAELSSSTYKPTGMETLLVDKMVQDAITSRMENAEIAFTEAANKVLTHTEPVSEDPTGPTLNAKGFAAEVRACARELAILLDHGPKHDLVMDPKVSSKFADLKEHLIKLLQPGVLALEGLSNEELRELGKDLKLLGVTAPLGEIEIAIQERGEVPVKTFQATVGRLLEAVKAKDATAMIKELRQIQQDGANLVRIKRELGTGVDDAAERTKLRGDLIDGVLRKMNVEDLTEIQKALASKEVQSLASDLTDTGMTVIEKGEVRELPYVLNLGKEIYDAADVLNNLISIAEVVMGDKDLEPMPRQEVSSFEKGHRSAIRKEFGVNSYAYGSMVVEDGLLSGRTEVMFKDQALSEPSGKELVKKSLSDGRELNVTDEFWRDLDRSTFKVVSSEGRQPELVVDKQALVGLSTQEKERHMEEGVEKLNVLFEGDLELVMRISQFSHQGRLAGLQIGLMSTDSPVMLPDGTRGRLLLGQDTNSFEISKDKDGNAVIRASYTISGARQLLDANTQQRIHLVGGGNQMTFTYEIKLPKDGGPAVLTSPGHFNFKAEVDTEWPKELSYPRPLTYSDVFASEDPGLIQAMEGYGKQRGVGENFGYVRDEQLYRKDPTLEKAVELFKKHVMQRDEDVEIDFLNQDLPQEMTDSSSINIPGALRDAIQLKLIAMGADLPLPLNAKRPERIEPSKELLLNLFGPATKHIDKGAGESMALIVGDYMKNVLALK